ncbi:MAG: MFS transporter [Acetobacteraceae bacterium]|nr:MFS transporter [Acetobacteraceae bacterium]
MASEITASDIKPRGFLATPSYLRLWFAGGVGNAMRWLELLVAGIFTYEVTQSTVLVALVTVARTLPMLFIGTIAGMVGEALNRKRLLVTQLSVMAVSSATLCALAFSAQIRVWHIAVGGIVTGIVWAMEVAVRRRMIGEVVMAVCGVRAGSGDAPVWPRPKFCGLSAGAEWIRNSSSARDKQRFRGVGRVGAYVA